MTVVIEPADCGQHFLREKPPGQDAVRPQDASREVSQDFRYALVDDALPNFTELYRSIPNYTELCPHSNSWRISLRDVRGCLDVGARRRQCWKWMMERRIDSAKNRAQGDAYARGQGIQI